MRQADQIITLRFENRDADIDDIKLRVDRAAVPVIMAWYGAYYAGDDYDVFVNGRPVDKDRNGEFQHTTIDGCSTAVAKSMPSVA